MSPIPPEGGSEPTAGRSAGARPAGVLVEERIAIEAPADVVWELISDLPGWSQWNPLYRKAGGALEPGGTITMTVTVPGSRPIDVRARITDLVAGARVQYQAQGLAGLLKGTRYVTIEKTGDGSCRVANGEIMGGLLGRLLARGAAERVRMGLQLMCEALKKVAEARWQGRSARAFSTDDRPD